MHAVVRFVLSILLVGFLDVDEFVVLRQDERLPGFLTVFPMLRCVPQLACVWPLWILRQSSGAHYASLIRRMSQPASK